MVILQIQPINKQLPQRKAYSALIIVHCIIQLHTLHVPQSTTMMWSSSQSLSIDFNVSQMSLQYSAFTSLILYPIPKYLYPNKYQLINLSNTYFYPLQPSPNLLSEFIRITSFTFGNTCLLILSHMIAEGEEKSQKDKDKKKVKWINPLKDRTRVVPFVVPNQEERMSALGSLAGEKWRLKKSLQAILSDFDPIKKPQPGENLYQRQEDGQGFGLFASMYRNHIDVESEIIYIATFHCKLSEAAIRSLKKKCKGFFHGAKLKLHKFNHKIDLTQFDPMESQNGQIYYDAAKMNVYFSKNLPKKCYSIAILTNLLIYNGDNPVEELAQKWVFGLGSIKDRTSITTVEEIAKKGYGSKMQGEYEDQINMTFLGKVINHELCHTFAMRHCIYFTCLMNGTSGYEQASKKVEHLCPVCLRKLQLAINFDILERYQKIGDQKSLMLAEKVRAAVGDKK